MYVAIDYDGVWTEDPPFWATFVTMLRLGGHEVIMVTQRGEQYLPEMRKNIPGHVNLTIITCPGVPKGEAVRQRGFPIDVWIDGNPAAVYEGLRYTGPDQLDFGWSKS